MNLISEVREVLIADGRIGESRVTFAIENCSLVFYYFRKNAAVNHFRLFRLKMI